MELLKEKSEMKFIKELYRSEFFNELLELEYSQIIKDNTFLKDHIHINLAYISKSDDDLELGVYITNNSEVEVNIKALPIALYEKDIKIFETIAELLKDIPSKKAIFFQVIIPNIIKLEEVNSKDFRVDFGDLSTVSQYPLVDVDVNNMPKINGYKSHREMKKFLKLLPTIKKDQLTIDVFKVGQVEEGFCIIALFRNSSSKAINIKSIPLTVLVSENLPVYKGVYNINDDGLIIESNKGKFYSIIIPLESFIQIDYEDMSKYIVKFE